MTNKKVFIRLTLKHKQDCYSRAKEWDRAGQNGMEQDDSRDEQEKFVFKNLITDRS